MPTAKLTKLINIWYALTVAGILIICIKFALPLILPFLLALVVAIVLKSPIKYLESITKLKRNALSFICVTLVLILLITLISLLVYSIYAWLSDVLTQLPELLTQLTDLTSNLTDKVSAVSKSMPDSIRQFINNVPSQIISSVTGWITDALSSFASGFPSAAVAVLVTVFASYIVTRDYYKLADFAKKMMPSWLFEKMARVRSVALNKTLGMLKGYSLLTLITFVLLLAGFFLLGVKHATALAAVTALIDLLPILGTGIILIPWAAFIFINGNTAMAIGILLLYAVVSLVHNLLSPKILADQMKLDTLCVLASMYIGFKLMSVTGMIIAPFITAVARDVIME